MANKTGKTQPDFSVTEPFLIPYPDQRGISDGYVINGDYNKASEFIDPRLEDLTTSGLFPMSRISPGGIYQFGDGSVSAPSISFATDTDTGFYKSAASRIDLTIDGTREVTFNSSGIQIADMTQGSVLFAGASGQISQNNASFFWDNTNSRLGIGTVSPSVALDVNGDIRDRNMTAGSVLYAGTNGVISQNNSNYFWDSTNKWLGIGPGTATTPLRALHIFGSATVRPEFQMTNAAASPKSWHFSVRGSSATDGSADFAIVETGVAAQFYLLAGGSLGLNTSTPRAHLDILDASGSQLRLTFTDNSVYNDFQTTSSGALVMKSTANLITIQNGTAAQTLRIYGNASTPAYAVLSHTGTNAQFTTNNSSSFQFGTNGTINWQINVSHGGWVALSNYRFSHGTSALATNATEGFFHLQSCAGTPTGTPASILTGQIPMVIDSTNLIPYFYSTFWRSHVGQEQANGQQVVWKSVTELTTIAAAATTDTAIQIPVDAVVLGVSVRVTVAIPTAATFTVTGTTSGTQFDVAGGVSTAANTTDTGTRNCPYKNGAAQTIRITPNAVPAANTGRVRVTIHYYTITPSAS